MAIKFTHDQVASDSFWGPQYAKATSDGERQRIVDAACEAQGKPLPLAVRQEPAANNLHERKAATDDLLELTEHELKKKLRERVKIAEKAFKEAKKSQAFREAASALDAARLACILPHFNGVGDELIGLASILNNLNPSDPSRVELHGRVKMWLFDEPSDSDPVTRTGSTDAYILAQDYWNEYNRHPEGEDLSADETFKVKVAFLTTVEGDNSGRKHVRVRVRTNHGAVDRDSWESLSEAPPFDYDAEGITRSAICSCDGALYEARQEFFTACEPLWAAEEALTKAQKDLEGLDDNMQELKMQSIAQRVRETGGNGVLNDLMGSVGAILNGETLDGIAASGIVALPEASEGEA